MRARAPARRTGNKCAPSSAAPPPITPHPVHSDPGRVTRVPVLRSAQLTSQMWGAPPAHPKSLHGGPPGTSVHSDPVSALRWRVPHSIPRQQGQTRTSGDREPGFSTCPSHSRGFSGFRWEAQARAAGRGALVPCPAPREGPKGEELAADREAGSEVLPWNQERGGQSRKILI